MKGFARRVVGEVLRAGAETAEVTLLEKREFTVEVRRGAVEKLIESVSSAIDVELSIDRRKALLSSSDLSDGSLSALVAEGIELARVMDRDEYFGLPDPAELGAAPGDLALFDPEVLAFPAERAIALATELERTALALDGRIIPDGSAFASRAGTTAFANSLGFCEGWRRTSSSLSLSCAVEDRPERSENTGKRQSSWWYSTAIRLADLESVESIARRAVERTLRKIGARKPRTCEVPVVFDPFTARGLLDAIAEAMKGGNIYRKSSFLVGRLGERVGSPLVNVVDDALMPGKLGTRPFDAEGVRSRRTVVFDAGTLASYLCSTYSGRKIGRPTTGNAGGVSNFHLLPGRSTPEEIVASVDQGLYLTSLFGPGANWMTGDFSQGAQGMWIEKGELAYPIDEFTIAGTFPAVLRGVVMVGDDVDWRDAIAAPTIKIERMTVSGA